jgi:hypothetical protein
VRVVRREQHAVRAELRHVGREERILAFEADVALPAPDQLTGVAAHPREQRRPLLAVLGRAVGEVGQPAEPGLQEGHPQLLVPVQDAAEHQRGERHHLVDRERQQVDLGVVVEPVGSGQRQVHAGRAVDPDREVVVGDHAEEAVQGRVVEVAVADHRGDGHRPGSLRGEALDLGHGPLRVLEGHGTDPDQAGRMPGTDRVEQPVVVLPREVGGEARIGEPGDPDGQPAVQHLDVDALGVHVLDATVDVGRSLPAGRMQRAVDGDPATPALLQWIGPSADPGHGRATRGGGREPSRMALVQPGPRQRILADVGIGVDDHRVGRRVGHVVQPGVGVSSSTPASARSSRRTIASHWPGGDRRSR